MVPFIFLFTYSLISFIISLFFIVRQWMENHEQEKQAHAAHNELALELDIHQSLRVLVARVLLDSESGVLEALVREELALLAKNDT